MDAFISHSSNDAKLSTRVERALEEGGLKVWLDLFESRAPNGPPGERRDMRYWHSGITVCHGTSDAPAPGPTAPPGVPILVTVAVRPINSGYVVTVRYCVNAGAVRAIRAQLVDTDHGSNTQYFEAMLPPAAVGVPIRFVAVFECNGRKAPDRTTVAKLPATFTAALDATPIPRRPVAARREGVGASADRAGPAGVGVAERWQGY